MRGVFYQRANEHIQYLRRMELALEGQGDVLSTDCRTCNVGQWIAGDAPSQIESGGATAREAFALMTLSHDRFHAAGARAFAAKESGDIEAVRRCVTDIVMESNGLVTLLLELDHLCKLRGP